MLSFLTSLSFLYAFTIALLLWYGFVYYRSFAKNGSQKRRFPLVFLAITAACVSFLYFNIHAPLRLHTFSNLDHHFIRHEGFRVSQRIELGRNDTINYKTNSFNRFVLERKAEQLHVNAPYSEEPFYISSGKTYRVASVAYPANLHKITLQFSNGTISINTSGENKYSLSINNDIVCTVNRTIKKGLTAWNIFREDTGFVNSSWYTDDRLINGLRNISLIRDNVSRDVSGELKYFLSGRIFQQGSVYYDEKALHQSDLAFTATIPDQTSIAWGLGFLDNNRNQFRVNYRAVDSFDLANRFPVSYPMTEEKGKEGETDWSSHRVNKFLVSDTKDLLDLPPVFGEGFLFSPFSGDSTLDFQPVLLSYKKDGANASLQLVAKFLNHTTYKIDSKGNQLLLPAGAAGFNWVFSIQNSFNWKLGQRTFSASTWQWLLFGILFFFFVMVFASSWLKPSNKLSWIWQLLSCVSMVMLTTRFFLYWRYKSFPPYEAMDLPSVQQLNSFWNFGVILLTGFLLAIIFGWGFVKYLFAFVSRKKAFLFNRTFRTPEHKELISEENISRTINLVPFFKRRSTKTLFFFSWVLLLFAGGGIAAFNDFDPTTCRHLAIVLVLFYFIFLYISYRHSPLVASAEKSWWVISTGRLPEILVNNPVKVLLSLSLLGLFAFVDMGFAIIFLNFLLFNEAFLCINYGIAGLSAGSKKNAVLFGFFGAFYMLLFVINLVAGPYIFKWLLGLPQLLYTAGYILFAFLVASMLTRLLRHSTKRKKILLGLGSGVFLFITAFLFFPKERILEKAAITQYRIDVMTMPVDQAVRKAYEDGKTYEPVIRAAQNQWFINTFIYEKNNPSVNSVGFHLLPHAPQNKGAKYNAQATDLVTSRFMVAEHGRWSVLLYILLLLLPIILLASFYKLYPDFTNRINTGYPTITTGFSLLNYLLVTALLVILAATGRYIFFGQDLPFGSILSKQSILFPSILLVAVVLLFKNISLERYPNRKKFAPGVIVFTGLAVLLFFVKPVFNKNKEFAVTDLAKDMDSYIQLRLQPLFDEIDTAKTTRKLSIAKKDRLFADTVQKLAAAGWLDDAGEFFSREIEQYARSSFSKHLDQKRMLYLDLNAGKPQLAVNDNYFRVEPPPHLQQSWSGNVFSDTSNYNISLWNGSDNSVISKRISRDVAGQDMTIVNGLSLVFRKKTDDVLEELCLVNSSGVILHLKNGLTDITLNNNDTLALRNPDKFIIREQPGVKERIVVIQPDAFMRNYFVNGNRFYVYPMGKEFIWARNFSESISSEYAVRGRSGKDVFLSMDAEMTDSLSARISNMLNADTAYKKGAEYGICIADAEGRLIVMPDFIKGLERPDPNDKAGFNTAIRGENGFISQSLLRKEIGNINMLRMNPGPGSTLKPIVFSSIASQLNLNWDAFAAEGFSQKQEFFGGEKVAEYDFEKNNGRIASVADYLKYSDNYYYADLLLLGSYTKQDLQTLLLKHFARQNPEGAMHWPYFSYNGQQYWLNGFENWPGYANGKANFGSDSSFISVGLYNNYGIYTYRQGRGFEKFNSTYDSMLLSKAYKKSGFILPEYALFDQKGTGMDMSKPNEVFMSSFRGHVKGSSQVMIPPVKMLDAFGKLVTQNRNYSLTLNPAAGTPAFSPFYVDNGVRYSDYLTLMKESVFTGMREALFRGTAARLGSMLKDGSPYYYYAKTGTTGDEESKKKSKLFTIIISQKNITDPDFNFRKNKFYTVYFTSQNGPAKQNEEFQAAVIKYIEASAAFNRYMKSGDQ